MGNWGNLKTLDERKGELSWAMTGEKVAFVDKKGKITIGTVRIREVRCGKKNCSKCPHRSYAYVQYRVGKKATEKYVGVVR